MDDLPAGVGVGPWPGAWPDDPRYDRYWGAYHQLMERRGVTEPTARNLVRSSPTLIAALAVRLGDADAMIAGAYGRFRTHFNHVRDVIGTREGVKHMAALSLLVMPTRWLHHFSKNADAVAAAHSPLKGRHPVRTI